MINPLKDSRFYTCTLLTILTSSINRHLQTVVAMVTETTILSTRISLGVVNILMLGLGVYLLVNVYRKQRRIQYLLLTNLASSELVKNAVLLVRNSLKIAYISSSSKTKASRLFTSFVCMDAVVAGLNYNYILAMLYLTADRILNIILNLKYPVYCTISKCSILLVVTWSLCLTGSLVYSLCVYLIGYREIKKHGVVGVINVHIPTGVYVIYVIFAIVVYVLIFVHFARSYRQFHRIQPPLTNTTTQTSNASSQSTFVYIFKHSRFYVSIVIISSYLTIMVVPNLIRSGFTGSNFSKQFSLYYYTSSALSDTVDSMVYVFLQPKVRRLLLHIGSSCSKSVQHTSHFPVENDQGFQLDTHRRREKAVTNL